MKQSATCWGVVLSALSVVLLLCANPAWAQLPADVPTPDIPGAPVSGVSGEGIVPPCAGIDRPPGIEEYGSFNVNGVLGNLGASGGYVAIPYNSVFNQDYDGAVEAWIYPTATTSSAPAIIGKGSTTTVGFLFGVGWATSKLYFRIGSTPTTNSDGTTIPLDA